jgi:sigma-E factor negative regulatory protein RseB
LRRVSQRVFLGVALTLALNCALADQDARAWLDRMNKELATRNYDGTIIHFRNGKVETLRIVHRVEGGKVSERLQSLDGSGREIIRNEDELTCYLPDQRKVLVEPRQDRGPLMGTLPTFESGLSEYYQLEKQGPDRVFGRHTQVIAVSPKDGYRFGYRLWIDERTAMPLKTQLCDEKGNVIEQILFTNISMPERIPKSEVQAAVRSEGFQWVRQSVPQQNGANIDAMWQVSQVPPGFRLTATNRQVIEGSNDPVAHLVYSDGLASVSVFIEMRAQQPAQLKGFARVGSAVTFSTTVRGHLVTAVGEVPKKTVQLIAFSVKPTVQAEASRDKTR